MEQQTKIIETHFKAAGEDLIMDVTESITHLEINVYRYDQEVKDGIETISISKNQINKKQTEPKNLQIFCQVLNPDNEVLMLYSPEQQGWEVPWSFVVGKVEEWEKHSESLLFGFCDYKKNLEYDKLKLIDSVEYSDRIIVLVQCRLNGRIKPNCECDYLWISNTNLLEHITSDMHYYRLNN
jgi:hypothetical protein